MSTATLTCPCGWTVTIEDDSAYIADGFAAQRLDRHRREPSHPTDYELSQLRSSRSP